MNEHEAVAKGHLLEVLNELHEAHGAWPEKILIRQAHQELYAVQFWLPYEKEPQSFYVAGEMVEDDYLITPAAKPSNSGGDS